MFNCSGERHHSCDNEPFPRGESDGGLTLHAFCGLSSVLLLF